MVIELVAMLAQAAALLESARDSVDSGSKEWDRIYDIQQEVEKMVVFEVTDTWPEVPDQGAPAQSNVPI